MIWLKFIFSWMYLLINFNVSSVIVPQWILYSCYSVNEIKITLFNNNNNNNFNYVIYLLASQYRCIIRFIYYLIGVSSSVYVIS